jgi:Ca-activated chloride channel family protein
MRRLLLPSVLLVLVSLVAGACGASGPSSRPASSQPPAHYLPTLRPEEPLPTPYDGVTFEDPGVNPFVDTADDRESTFGLDVDTASYTIARRWIEDGNLPDPASIRVEEFVNAFDQGYAAPETDAFAIHADGGPSPFLDEDEVLLRIGIKAREVGDRERPDAALTFVVDVSGSMAREDRLELVKRSLALLVEELRPRDTVALVVYGSDARVVLPPTRAREADEILAAIGSLQPEGSTNAEAGLRLGYALARETLVEGGINRVILASDGVANVGVTDAQGILEQIRHDADAGIQLVTVGFGMGNYNDVLLEQLADDGDGFYAYVDQLDEARRLFVEDLTGTLQTVALDARVQVEFNPDTVEAYRLIGFENRAIDDDDFRDDDVEAGAIGAGHASTALYALRLERDAGWDARLATVSLRWTDPESRRADELAEDVHGSDLAESFRATEPAFQLDALVAAAAERFRDSRWGRRYELRDVLEVADEIARDLPATAETDDFLSLLEQAARLER